MNQQDNCQSNRSSIPSLCGGQWPYFLGKVTPLCPNWVLQVWCKLKTAEQTFPSLRSSCSLPTVGDDVCLREWLMNLLLVQHCSWRRAWISGPVFTQVRGYMKVCWQSESVLSMAGLTVAAALSATALADGWEGPQAVKATSTNCVIDHGSGQ